MPLPVLAETVLDADAASISLDGLDLAGYLCVRVVAEVRSADSPPWERAIVRFNDDAADNYVWAVRNDDGSNVTSDDAIYINGIEGAHLAGSDFPFYWGANVYDLMYPGVDSIYKSLLLLGTIPIGSQALATYGAGFWKSTDPITKVELVANAGGNFRAGSKLAVIGLATYAGADPGGTVSGPPPALAADAFNRADGALGANWTVPSAALHNVVIASGKAVAPDGPSSPSHDAYWAGWTGGDDHYSEAEVPGAVGVNRWLGVTARATGLADNYLAIYFNNGGTYVLMLFKGVGGSYTQIGSTYTIGAAPLAAGDVLRIEAQGTAIRAKVNGATLVSATDAAVTTGAPGISVFGVASDGSLDNWQAGVL